MASIKRTGITDKGKDLITREIAGITELTFTKISASSNKLADTVNLETLINIDGVKQTVNVSKVEKIGTSQIKVTATFNNSGLMNGYGMETLGIYAKDTTGTEVLFAVTVAGTSDYMPATNGINLSTVTVELIFNLSNTDNVSLSVDTAALVTVGMFDSFKSKVNKDYVKYTDLATETVPGIITYAKIKEIAPKPDLSPYIPFSKGYRSSNNVDWVLRANKSETWMPLQAHMYDATGNYVGSFHTNGGRAYYKVPNRNGGNWCEIMDNFDMATRDSNIQHAHARITDTWNYAVNANGRFNWSNVYNSNNYIAPGGSIAAVPTNWNEIVIYYRVGSDNMRGTVTFVKGGHAFVHNNGGLHIELRGTVIHSVGANTGTVMQVWVRV
nr:MAG TPA: tail collar fiber protein [Caudoviricetes sp.]